jgi:hypothetical protein
MRVYLFNSENGLYAGETFEEPDKLRYEDGVTPVSPPDFAHGQVPVFDRRRNDWTVIPVTIARQLLNISTSEPTGSKL